MADVRGGRADPVAAFLGLWWLILSAGLVGAVLLGAYTHTRQPVFTSQASILIGANTSLNGLLSDGSGAVVNTDRDTAAQAGVLVSDSVINPVARAVRSDPAEVRDAIHVSSTEGSDILVISGEASTSRGAQGMVDALVGSYTAYTKAQAIQSLTTRADALQAPINALQGQYAALPATSANEAQRGALVSQLTSLVSQQVQLRSAVNVYTGPVSVLSAADHPLRPSSLTIGRAAALGGSLGIACGFLLAFLVASRPESRSRRGRLVGDRHVT